MSMDQAPRTFVCGVVSVDLVGYSKLPVSDQIDLKARFNTSLGDTLNPIAADGRIILDTGDGVVVGFLNDPEDALYFAMALSRSSEAMAAGSGQGRLRIGINLGPVRLGTDLNQHPTLVGDGVNVAEQIMSFARPGTVVASRAFHDFAGRLSGAYESLFHFEGSRTDKHVRDHEVYTVRDDDRAFQVVRRGVLERAGLALPQDAPAVSPSATSPGMVAPPAPRAPSSGTSPAFLHDPAKVGFAALLLTAIALVEGYLLWNKLSSRAAPVAPTQLSSAPAANPAETAAVPTAPAAAPVSPPAPAAAATTGAAPTPVPAPARPDARKDPGIKVSEPQKASPGPISPPPPVAKAAPAPVPAPAPTSAAPKPAVDDKRAPDVRKPVDAAADPKRAPRKNEPAPKAVEPVVQSLVDPAPVAAPAPPPVPTPQPAPPPAATALEPIARTAPEFPIAAVRQGISEGRVKARARIDAAGNVTSVEILSAYPQRLFDRAVMESVSRWKFPPGSDRRSYEVDVEFKR